MSWKSNIAVRFLVLYLSEDRNFTWNFPRVNQSLQTGVACSYLKWDPDNDKDVMKDHRGFVRNLSSLKKSFIEKVEYLLQSVVCYWLCYVLTFVSFVSRKQAAKAFRRRRYQARRRRRAPSKIKHWWEWYSVYTG